MNVNCLITRIWEYNYFKLNYKGTEKVIFITTNIEVYSKVLLDKHENIEFIDFGMQDKNGEYEAVIESDMLARIFDYQSSEIRYENKIIPCYGSGWDYLNIYFIIYGIIRIKCLSDFLAREVSGGEKIFMFMYNNPPDYYFQNEVSQYFLYNTLKNMYSEVGLINITSPYYKPNAYSNKIILPEGYFENLIHLPTVFYERNRVVQEISKRDIRKIDIESPYWDVPVLNDRARLLEPIEYKSFLDNEAKKNYLIDYKDLLKKLLVKFSIPKDVYSRMEVRLLLRSIFQIESYSVLEKAKSISSVKLLDISDHDTGLHGPLMTIAQNREWLVNVEPHSGYVIGPLPFTDNSKSDRIFKPLKFSSTLRLDNCLPNSSYASEKRVTRRFDKNNKNIIIVLNELDDVVGVPHLCLVDLIEGMSFFYETMVGKGYSLRIRHKPSHSYENLIGLNIEKANGSIDDCINWADYYLGIGEPTSLITKFYLNGATCMQISSETIIPSARNYLPEGIFIVEKFDYKLLFQHVNNFLEELC
jgi:hypothetical protein